MQVLVAVYLGIVGAIFGSYACATAYRIAGKVGSGSSATGHAITVTSVRPLGTFASNSFIHSIAMRVLPVPMPQLRSVPLLPPSRHFSSALICPMYCLVWRLTGFWCGNLREKDHLGDPGVDGNIILSQPVLIALHNAPDNAGVGTIEPDLLNPHVRVRLRPA